MSNHIYFLHILSRDTIAIMPKQSELLELLRRLIQPLIPSLHKGQAGRIVVVGGCEDYTGAPFFSAHLAALTGADLSHVVCETMAAPIIKLYSPDLMVHPYLYDSHTIKQLSANIEKNIDLFDNNPVLDAVINDVILPKISAVLSRSDVVVVGPGYGRDNVLLRTLVRVIEELKVLNKPVIFDADALYLLLLKPSLVHNYPKAVLTPNVVEFKRIADAAGILIDAGDLIAETQQVLRALKGVTIIRKGGSDVIVRGDQFLSCELTGSNKRVGGQGDTLTGALATILNWSYNYQQEVWDTKSIEGIDAQLLAGFAACSLVRHAASKAYLAHGRSMQTSNVHQYLHAAYEDLFGSDERFREFVSKL